MNNKLRSYFPVLNSCTYFNTAYVGPMSIQLFEFRNKLEKEYLNDGDKFKIDNIERIDDFRETISGFINSKKENTFFTSNFSTGFRYILDLIPKKSKILTLKDDYNSLLSGINEREFIVDDLSITFDFEIQIENQLAKKTYDILAISVVQFLSGIKVDFGLLKKIKEKYPKLIIIGDSTQFIGSDLFSFKDSPFDVIIGSGYKWMLAGFGNAYMAVSDNFIKQTRSTSQIIYEKVYAGHINFLGSASLNFSIKFLQQNNFHELIKIKKILGNFLIEGLKDLNLINPIIKSRKNHSNIYTIIGDDNLYNKLQSHGIRCSLRGEGVRLSVHFYNSESEIDYLLKVLKKSN